MNITSRFLVSITLILSVITAKSTFARDAELSKIDLNKQLIKAAEDGNAKRVKDLIAAGANVNTAHWLSGTALMTAAGSDDNIDVVRALIAAGADLNTVNMGGETALMKAAEGHSIDVVRALVAAGANVKATNGVRMTARELAEQRGYDDIVNVIDDPQEDLNDRLVYAAHEPKTIAEKAVADDNHISNIRHHELRNYVQTKHLEFNNLKISFIGQTFPADKVEGFGIHYLLPDNETLACTHFLDHPLPNKNDVISVIKACALHLKSLELTCSDITSDELVEALGEAKLFTSLTLCFCKNFQQDDYLATKLVAVCPSFKELVFQSSV